MNEKQKLQQALRSLNPVQHEAVISNANSLQIVAGPGSGKTKVLTCRVSYLIIEKNVNPSDIIVVTFTKKASTELKERLCLLIGSNRTNLLQIGTFHSICISILRRNARIVDMEPSFKVVDDRKRKEIIRALMKDESLPVKYAGRQIKADVILAEIENAKERGENHIKFQNMYSGGSSYYKSIISIYYMAYEAELRRQNIMDFGGLILKTCELLRQKDDVFYNIDCVLVDEFQDTSTSQYDIIALLLAQDGHRTITTVGDPDQSIYGWRSAKSRVFQEMQDSYPDTKVINLEQNYRSTAKVVDSANHVIVQDTGRIDKALYTNNPIGIPISLIITSDEKKQAEYVAYEIGKVINYSKGLIEYKDMAVLMRANYSSRQFERTFRVHKIPFNLKGGDKFFNRMEIKDMLGYLRFASNPYDVASFDKIINVPERNIRKYTINRILDMNETFGGSMLDTIEIFLHDERRLFSGDRNELKNFLNLCHHIHRKIVAEEHISEILKFIYEETKYFQHLVQHHFYDHIGRWKNLGELVTIAGSKKEKGGYEDEDPEGITAVAESTEPLFIAKEEKGKVSLSQDQLKANFQKEDPEIVSFKEKPFEDVLEKEEPIGEAFSLEEEFETYLSQEQETSTSKGVQNIEEFLNYCDSCLNQKQQKANEGGSVTVSTIHAAKGLEWPCVFIVTCAKGVIPAQGGDDDEEKRILYVAMTRSKFLLYCISPEELGDWGQRKVVPRTPFLEDMDTNLFSKCSPVWNQELREMLANTIHRPTPRDEDFLRDSNLPKSTSSQPTPKSVLTTSVSRSSPGIGFKLYQPYSSSTCSKTNITIVPAYNTSHTGINYTSHQIISTSFSGLKRALDVDEDDDLIAKVKKEPKFEI